MHVFGSLSIAQLLHTATQKFLYQLLMLHRHCFYTVSIFIFVFFMFLFFREVSYYLIERSITRALHVNSTTFWSFILLLFPLSLFLHSLSVYFFLIRRLFCISLKHFYHESCVSFPRHNIIIISVHLIFICYRPVIHHINRLIVDENLRKKKSCREWKKYWFWVFHAKRKENLN